MTAIAAIETRYKGYRFRSRLEARWAVFFDALGLKWTYEPQGFVLRSGPYLPDFHISNLFDRYGTAGLYIEVKPTDQATHGLATDLCMELTEESSVSTLILVGPPTPPNEDHDTDGYFQMNPTGRDASADDSPVFWDNFMRFHLCDCMAVKVEFMNDYFRCPACKGASTSTYDHPALAAAAVKARSARFEHGETPS